MTQTPETRLIGKRVAARTLRVSLFLFIVIHPAALIGIVWTVSPTTNSEALEGSTPAAWMVGAAGLLVLAIWRARQSGFQRTSIIGFVMLEGVFIGGFVTYFEGVLPGVMLQLSFAAFSAIIAALAVLSTEHIRSASLINRILLVTVGGYLVFVLHNVGFMGMDFLPIHTAWGQGSLLILGVPVGLIVGLLLIPMASYALVRRVERVRDIASEGVRHSYIWNSALGLMITITWPWEKTPCELLR
jgi:uncharacterized YccA/Bax inhibitor family protein